MFNETSVTKSHPKPSFILPPSSIGKGSEGP